MHQISSKPDDRRFSSRNHIINLNTTLILLLNVSINYALFNNIYRYYISEVVFNIIKYSFIVASLKCSGTGICVTCLKTTGGELSVPEKLREGNCPGLWNGRRWVARVWQVTGWGIVRVLTTMGGKLSGYAKTCGVVQHSCHLLRSCCIYQSTSREMRFYQSAMLTQFVIITNGFGFGDFFIIDVAFYITN